MTLPTFTLTGTVDELVGGVSTPLAGTKVHLLCNVPPKGFLAIEGEDAVRLVTSVELVTDGDGLFSQELLADDESLGLDVTLQWSIKVAGFPAVWFDAPADGASLDLKDVLPVPGTVPTFPTNQGAPTWSSVTGKPTDLATTEDIAEAVGAVTWSSLTGKPTDLATTEDVAAAVSGISTGSSSPANPARAAIAPLLSKLRSGASASMIGFGDSSMMGINDFTGQGFLGWFEKLAINIATDLDVNALYVAWKDTDSYYQSPYLVHDAGSPRQVLAAANQMYPETADATYSNLEIVVQAFVTDWTVDGQTFIAKQGNGSPGSFALGITGTGKRVQFLWWDGTGTPHFFRTVPVPFANNTVAWLKATFISNNGSGGSDVHVYTSTDGHNWTELAIDYDGGMTTATGLQLIEAPFTLGLGLFFANLQGSIQWVSVKDGINGTDMVPNLPEAWGMVTQQPNLTTISGKPNLVAYNAGVGGTTAASLLQSPFWPKQASIETPDVAFVALSANDANSVRVSQFMANLLAYVDAIREVYPFLPIIVTSESPEQHGYLGNDYTIFSRRVYGGAALAVAAVRQGVYPLDTMRAFDGKDLTVYISTDDGVHPTPEGYQLEADWIFDQIVS